MKNVKTLNYAIMAGLCALAAESQLTAASYIESPLRSGGALRTENCNAYAAGTVTNLPARTGPFTIEGYVYVPGVDSTIGEPGFLFFQDGLACVEIYGGVGLDSSKYYLYFGVSTGNSREFAGPVFLGYWMLIQAGWHHIACVNDPGKGEQRVFLDGIITIPGYSSTSTFYTPPVEKCSIGGSCEPTPYPWGFYWDEIRLSSSARYAANFSPPTQPFEPDSDTVALWHFDEPPGATQFSDSSGNGNTLTGVNGADDALLGFRLQISKTQDSAIQLGLTGEAGKEYQIEWCTDLHSANWQTLTNLVLSGTTTNILDLNVSEPARKLYRAVQQ